LPRLTFEVQFEDGLVRDVFDYYSAVNIVQNGFGYVEVVVVVVLLVGEGDQEYKADIYGIDAVRAPSRMLNRAKTHVPGLLALDGVATGEAERQETEALQVFVGS